jgi:hypothetical protein
MYGIEISKDNEIRHVWRITLRILGTQGTDRSGSKHCWLVASKQSLNEAAVVKEARKRSSHDWWENQTVSDIEYLGKLVMFDGLPLYEKD